MASDLPHKLRVMVDANVLLSGIGWLRFPYEVLQCAVSGEIQLVLSTYGIAEVRKHIVRVLPDRVDSLDLFLESTGYEEVPSPTPDELAAYPDLVRDEKDIPVAVSAIKANVDCLVSLDKDLTDPDQPVHQYLKVILPGAFLREYMGWTSERLEAIHKRTWKDLKLDED